MSVFGVGGGPRGREVKRGVPLRRTRASGVYEFSEVGGLKRGRASSAGRKAGGAEDDIDRFSREKGIFCKVC